MVKKKRKLWWGFKGRDGKPWPSTFAQTKDGCWQEAWYIVVEELGEAWGKRWWRKFDASAKNAIKRGYRFCRIEWKEQSR